MTKLWLDHTVIKESNWLQFVVFVSWDKYDFVGYSILSNHPNFSVVKLNRDQNITMNKGNKE